MQKMNKNFTLLLYLLPYRAKDTYNNSTSVQLCTDLCMFDSSEVLQVHVVLSVSLPPPFSLSYSIFLSPHLWQEWEVWSCLMHVVCVALSAGEWAPVH